jgi:hypothetical protein
MTVYEFPLDVRSEVEAGIVSHCRFDKPAPPKGEEDHRRILRITLKHRDSHGHENELAEWDEHDLYGANMGVETLVRGVELAACRDAAYQFGGECVYVLSFHGKDHPNRSKFFFKIWGGQEVQQLAIARHSRNESKEEVGIAERLMPDLLKYVSDKEKRIDDKIELVFTTLTKQVTQLSSVVTEYTDRELKVREIMINADDNQYEREKRRREDEEERKKKEKTWELIQEHAPKAMPYILQAIQRFSGGPTGESDSAPFRQWVAEQQQAAEARASEVSAEGEERSNGHTASKASGGEKDSARSKEGGLDSSAFEQLQLQVALDTSRFVALIKMRGKLEVVREVLNDDQRALFDEIVKASDESDLEKLEDVERLSVLALMFGGAVQASPSVGFALLGALDGASKIALIQLSSLLKIYHEAMESRS